MTLHYLMQARSSANGHMVAWRTVDPDWAGDDFPGPGSPLYIAATKYVGQAIYGGLLPKVLSISPDTGPSSGGTLVTIEVLHSFDVFGFLVGGNAVTGFAIVDATHVSGTTASFAAGPADVVVENAAGSTSLLNAFTFTGGDTSVAVVVGVNYRIVDTGGGGFRVVVEVDDSSGSTGITAGGVAFTDFAIDDDTHVSGVPGAHAAGVVDVVVTNGAGDSTTGTGLIEYWDPSLMTGINTYYDARKGVTDGIGVSVWDDQSGNSFSATQADPTLQPTFTPNAFGPSPGITGFADATNGNPQSLMSDTGGFSAQSTFQYLAVIATTGTKNTCTANPLVSNPMGIFGGGGWSGFGMKQDAIEYQDFSFTARGFHAGFGLNDGNAHLVGASGDTGLLRLYLGATKIGSNYLSATTFTYYDHLFCGFSTGSPQDGFPGDVGAAITLTQVMTYADHMKLDAWSRQSFGTDDLSSDYPTSLYANLYFRGTGGAPWFGEPSAGDSNEYNAISDGNDPTLIAFGSHYAGHFDGTQYLLDPGTDGRFAHVIGIAGEEFSFNIVTSIDTFGDPDNWYDEPSIFSAGTAFGISVTSDGVRAGTFPSGSTPVIAATTATPMCIQVRCSMADGLQCRVNGSAWETVSFGGATDTTGGWAIGESLHDPTKKIVGQIAEVLGTSVVWDDTIMDALYADAQANFGVP